MYPFWAASKCTRRSSGSAAPPNWSSIRASTMNSKRLRTSRIVWSAILRGTTTTSKPTPPQPLRLQICHPFQRNPPISDQVGSICLVTFRPSQRLILLEGRNVLTVEGPSIQPAAASPQSWFHHHLRPYARARHRRQHRYLSAY